MAMRVELLGTDYTLQPHGRIALGQKRKESVIDTVSPKSIRLCISFFPRPEFVKFTIMLWVVVVRQGNENITRSLLACTIDGYHPKRFFILV